MATALATTERQTPVPEIVKFRSQLEERANELKMALPSHISAEKFQRTVITAIQQNPGLLGADRASLVLSCIKAAQDGLLPDGREAALVPFNQRYKDEASGNWKNRKMVQYMPMVYGLRKKILQVTDTGGNPVVRALETGVVYRTEVEQGRFYYEVGIDPPVRHKPSLDLTAEQAKDSQIVAAYSIATMADGTKSCEVMRRFEIDKVQNMSQTGSTVDYQGKPRNPAGPWMDWYPEMAKKTVMRRHSKTLPMSGDVILDLGTEQDELDAGASTAALLGNTPGGEPTAIEDHSDDQAPHDKETGELIEGNATDAGPKAEEAKPKKPAKAKAQPAADETPPADAGAAGDGGEPAQDEGDGEHPASIAAREIMGLFDKAETIIDLKGIYSKREADLDAMPPDIRETVETNYDANTARLKGQHAASREREEREAQEAAE